MDNDNEENGDDLFGFINTNDDNLADPDGGTLDDEFFTAPSKDSVIFCVDCGDIADLFSSENGVSKFYDSLTTFHSFMRSKVVSSDGSDMTGLVFYNLSSSSNELNQRGIYVVQDIGLISALRIQDIRSLRDMTISEFHEKFGHSSLDCGISDLLFVCNAMFKKTTASFRPRMFIFTPNDDPCGSDRRARKAALTRANDFQSINGAEIVLIPLCSTFRIDIFWDKLILLSANDEEFFVANSLIQLAEMKDVVLKKIFRKRPLNRVDFHISKNTKVALMIYTSIMPAGRPKHIYVDPQSLIPLRSNSHFVSEYTGEVLDPSEIGTFIEYEHQRVEFKKDDVLEIKQISQEKSTVSGQLFLIGFESKQNFKDFYSVSHSCFLYPQDSRIPGSALVCSALIDRLISRDMIAICRFTAKANSGLMLAALFPNKDGFHLVRLPWADDIRDLSLPGTNVEQTCQGEVLEGIRNKQVDAAKLVINEMSESNWEPEVLDNPALTQTYIVLESMALNLNATEVGTVVDLVGPDPAKVSNATNLALPHWIASLSISDTSGCQLGAGVAKKPKYEKAKADFKFEPMTYTQEDIENLVKEDKLKFETVDVLKEIIRTIPKLSHLNPTGKKAELLEKIQINILPK